ncbi:MAG: serine/threonine-protein kinase [Sandaracinaceae bacterium]
MTDPRVGRMVADRYRLDEVLGRGGMGVVYRGTHTWTERPVAVKLLLAEYASDARLLQRFFQEAKAAAGLRHPNVVDVLDMGEDDDGSAFLVLELLEGDSLEDRLADGQTLGAEEALRILLPVIDALDAAHARGVIHRDLKPANVFLSRGHRGAIVPKLLDFGVAKLTENATVQTRTGSVIGTPGYMSPEQIQGLQELTPASDVWGMGMLLHRVLVGSLPIDLDPNPTQMLISIVSQDRPGLADRWPEAPPALASAVDVCLGRAPETRYDSMRALADALIEGARAAGLTVDDPRDVLPAGGF